MVARCKGCCGKSSAAENTKDIDSDHAAGGCGNVELETGMKEAQTLACLINQSAKIETMLNQCTNINNDYEKFSVMVGSGASETVASHDMFPSYGLIKTIASGITYSSAAESQVEGIVNVGEKLVETVDENGVTSFAKFQMCKGLGKGKVLGNVSRLV